MRGAGGIPLLDSRQWPLGVYVSSTHAGHTKVCVIGRHEMYIFSRRWFSSLGNAAFVRILYIWWWLAGFISHSPKGGPLNEYYNSTQHHIHILFTWEKYRGVLYPYLSSFLRHTCYYVDNNGRSINIHAGKGHKCYRRSTFLVMSFFGLLVMPTERDYSAAAAVLLNSYVTWYWLFLRISLYYFLFILEKFLFAGFVLFVWLTVSMFKIWGLNQPLKSYKYFNNWKKHSGYFY